MIPFSVLVRVRKSAAVTSDPQISMAEHRVFVMSQCSEGWGGGSVPPSHAGSFHLQLCCLLPLGSPCIPGAGMAICKGQAHTNGQNLWYGHVALPNCRDAGDCSLTVCQGRRGHSRQQSPVVSISDYPLKSEHLSTHRSRDPVTFESSSEIHLLTY